MKLYFESKFGEAARGYWGGYFIMVGVKKDRENFIKFLTDLGGLFHAEDARRHQVSNRYFIMFDMPHNNNKRILYPFGTEQAILNFCKIMGYEIYEESICDAGKIVNEGKLLDYDLFSN